MAKTGVTRTIKKKAANNQPMRSGSTRKSLPFKRVTKQQIQWGVDRLVESLDPEKIILFGSYAYGKPTIDSDVDMLILMESEKRPTELAADAYRSGWGKTFPMDILVRSPKWIAHRLEIGDLLIREIIERGHVLYERRKG
ncbi:MAG TPA: nucleotidyltransferase domain-containing protein [Anaerolineae bacterium]|nr:nucleotidyltransferase domain-containing protein [Anaerolineae bacterium]